MSNHFWFVLLIWILVGLLLATVMGWLRERRLREYSKGRQFTHRKHQQLRDHQRNLGNRVYNAIKLACEHNRTVAMGVLREENDSTFGYFIIVEVVEDPTRALGKKVLDVSIKLDSPAEYEQVEVRWEGHLNHEWGYKMSARRFEDGPELQILAGRLHAYVPAVHLR